MFTSSETIAKQGGNVELQAELFAPSRAAGFVRPGQAVWLRYQAFPYQKFGMHLGDVIAISRSPFAPQDLPSGQGQALLAAPQANESMYRITVHLSRQKVEAYGETVPLTTGAALEADLRLDQRKVWEWLLEPMLSIGGKKNLGYEVNPSRIDYFFSGDAE